MSDSRIDALHKGFGTSKKRILSQIVPLRLHRIRVAAGSTVQEMIERYDSSPMVEYAEPNYYVHASAVPNDPYYPSSGTLTTPSTEALARPRPGI